MTILSLEMAKLMADAAEKKAIENNINIIISIYDGHGNLKYFHRMDNASFGSIQISQLKAKTSASLPYSTKSLAERAAPGAFNPYITVPGVILLGGGLPIITKDKQHIGGIGISGATQILDEICAQAGLDAIAKYIA